MIFSKDMKNLKIYKRKLFLPTLENSAVPNKKTGSAIFLLTPNRQSSLALMNNPLFINKKRYNAYYIERDVSFYINSKREVVEESSQEYVTEMIDNFTEHYKAIVYYEGYLPDVEILKKIFDAEDLNNILKDLKIKESEYPDLTLRVGEFPSQDEYFSFYVNIEDTPEGGKQTKISIHVPRHNSSEGYEEYSKRILNFVYKAIFITYNQDQYGTANPSIYADTMTGADTKYAGKSFNDFKGELYEAAPITIENLGKKFQYATTSKFKRQFSVKLNTLRRNLEKVNANFTPQINVPTVGSPSKVSENYLSELTEDVDYIKLGNDRITFLSEASFTDSTLRKLLYNERLRTRKEVLDLDKKIKEDCPFILFAYPELARYNKKNIFVDLYYYNQVFFKNNTYRMKRGFDIYLTLMNRLVNDPRITSAGYSKKTIFIPIKDWTRNLNTKMWIYREDINPISIIYELMFNRSQECLKVFGDTDLFFFDKDRYFKINFKNFKDPKNIKESAIKFKTFIARILSNATFESEDVDDSTTETPDAIKASIYDKIEDAKGVDLTGKEVIAQKDFIDTVKANKSTKDIAGIVSNIDKYKSFTMYRNNNLSVKSSEPNAIEQEVDKEKENLTISANKEKIEQKIGKLKKIAAAIDSHTSKATSEEDALEKMDQDIDLKKMLLDLDSLSDDSVNMDATRAARMNDLNDKFMEQQVAGKSIKDMLESRVDEQPIETTSLPVNSPNKEWQNMTYMNFDKKYDVNRDIIACLYHFSKDVTYPIGIRNINVEDTSTSEDMKVTYTVDTEDFRGTRQKIRFDVPIMKDNRFMLRGNYKTIATQFTNMPVLKTDLNTAQIITNYQKIFVKMYKNSLGRSNPVASRLIKTLQKYKGTKLKIIYGDNSRICNKYELPLDYIDIARVIDTIEIKSKNIKIYFNQDQIRLDYPNIDDTKGIPYMVEDGVIKYYQGMNTNFFAQSIVNILIPADKVFADLLDQQRATSAGTYVRASILNEKIPMILLLGFAVGLDKALTRAGINYKWTETLSNEDRNDPLHSYIRFEDGYLVYQNSYLSCLLLNGLLDCGPSQYSMADMNSRSTFTDMLENFCSKFKSDGLCNFIDCLIDPITKEILEHYKMPTDFVGVMIYATALMADNKYIKHTDTSSRRIRRAELIAAYTYEALSEAYGTWARELRRGRKQAVLVLKPTVVIDKILQSPITQDDSINNALGALEETNTIAYKGKTGLNNDRAYSLDKRTYDDSMLNVLGGSTNFSANAGIARQATINMNVEGARGFIKQIDSDTSKMNTVNTLTASEAMIPFEATNDDNTRVLMSYIQTAKHQVRVKKSDPLLVTSGADEALPYLTTNIFAYKADEDGKILLLDEEKMVIEYSSGQKEYIDLRETIKKNSDGGYEVPMKLIPNTGLKTGSKFKKGQILAYDPASFSNSLGEDDNIAYNVGTLAKVAVINSDEGYEDSGVCTHKLSDALTTQIIYKFDHVIEKDAIIYQVAKIGQYVNVGDPLLVWQDPFDDSDLNLALKVMADKDLSTLGRKVIESQTTGTVVDIKIFKTCENSEMSDSVRNLVESYEKPIKKLKKELDGFGVNTKTLPATYALPTTGKLKKAEDAIYVEIYVEHPDIPGVGDKITYFAANKAVLRNIIPVGDEPYTDFRPDEEVSAMLSVSSINKRMVTSILMNGALNKLMIELDRSCKDLLGIPYDVKNL